MDDIIGIDKALEEGIKACSNDGTGFDEEGKFQGPMKGIK
jgi:hypothetical protein